MGCACSCRSIWPRRGASGAERARALTTSAFRRILATQSADPNAVAAERRKAFRMDGLLPDDAEALRAMSPNVADVVKARVSPSGELYKSVLTAGQREYDGLTRCALRRAGELLDGIGRESARPRPRGWTTYDPCRYCDGRVACGFDDRVDSGRARKFRPMTGQEALAKFAEEAPDAGGRTEKDSERI